MNAWQRDVQDFHKLIGQPISPAEPKLREEVLRARLIGEEAIETMMALVGPANGYTIAQELLQKAMQKMAKTDGNPNLVEAIDGLCDTIVVCLGTAEAIGVDLEPFWKAVHDSNMKKADGPVDENGKKGKPEGWKPPDVAGILAKMIYTQESVG